MSHNLNINNGKVSFFESGSERAWHGLGQRVDTAVTASEAIKLAGLDFQVTTERLQTLSGIQAPAFATKRVDNNEILGVVGERYEVIQNVEAFSFFDALTLQNEAMYQTAGVLGKGEMIWVLAKLPDYIRVGDDDLIEKYVCIANSHDGSLAVTAMLTPIRVVCSNTLNAALSSAKSRVSIRHTANAKQQIAIAHKLLGLYDKRAVEIGELFNSIANQAASDSWVKDALKIMVPDNEKAKNKTRTENIRKSMFEFYESGVGQDGILGTKWGFYNGVTGWTDHKKYDDVEKAFKNSMFGRGEAFKAKALNLALTI